MFKSIVATLALTASALVIGYHADTIASAVANKWQEDTSALVSFFTYDAKAEFYACVNGGTKAVDIVQAMARVEACQSHMDAWVSRDGREAVGRAILKQGMADVSQALSGLVAKP